ncbi:hypothetical protein GOP47_0029479 [Adiantum capillus-veneris]|nr:hypothetical protein GOP47_0029479 [Adiantum capillus-veneris]
MAAQLKTKSKEMEPETITIAQQKTKGKHMEATIAMPMQQKAKGKAIEAVTRKPLVMQTSIVTPNMTKKVHQAWKKDMGFDTLISQKWQGLANPEGSMDIMKNICETDTIVVQNREPVLVDEALVSKSLGLTNQGSIEPNKVYPISNEIPRKGTMHHIKDVADAERRA